MKQGKILLIGIAILATISGVLAFKVNRKFKKTFCVATTVNPPPFGWCNEVLVGSQFFALGSGDRVTYYYTTKPVITPCDQLYLCTRSTSFQAD